MMNVDPIRRASLEQVKAHPSFKRGLSLSYILPTPIPFLSFSESIDPNTVSSDIIKLLQQIGFTDDNELREELQSQENTMAKVFISMLSAHIDLEKLPWDKSPSGGTHYSPMSPKQIMINQESFFNYEDGSLHFSNSSRRPSLEFGNSMAIRPEWIVEAANISAVFGEITIDFEDLLIYDIMCRIEEISDEKGMQWFHPDPLTMYIRSQDVQLYLSINATFYGETKISIQIRHHKGTPEQFAEFADYLKQTIGSTL